MGIGPSTKETSLHHFRDPLLDVVSSDTDLDLMGIIIVGTPDAVSYTHLLERLTVETSRMYSWMFRLEPVLQT